MLDSKTMKEPHFPLNRQVRTAFNISLLSSGEFVSQNTFDIYETFLKKSVINWGTYGNKQTC